MTSARAFARCEKLIKGGDLAGALQWAAAAQNAGDVLDAGRAWRAILRKWPGQAEARNGQAMSLAAAGRHAEALQILADLCHEHPDNPGLWMNRGMVEKSLGQLDTAVTSFEQAIQRSPRYRDPYYSLCDVLLNLDRADEAVQACDRCMDQVGRDFHALAFKTHALRDAGRDEECRRLLDHDHYVHAHEFTAPYGFDSITQFNQACARFVSAHPTLRANVMSTEHGKHTGELLMPFNGPMEPLRETINKAAAVYLKRLPDDHLHPMHRWQPAEWKITSWGVVMFNKGHERAHIHPRGWLSGVFYLDLPDLLDDPARAPEGWLEFGRPTSELHVKREPELRHYQPRYGSMYLFPSYFYHGTVPFRSEQRRVCVAFDIEPVRYAI